MALPQQRRPIKREDKSKSLDGKGSSLEESGEGRKAWVTITLALSLLAIAALNSPVSQKTLAPVFGAIPAAVNHTQAITATVLLGYIWRAFLKSPHNTDILPYLALFVFWMPAIQNYFVKYSTKLGPIAGPILLGFLSCHTVIIACAYSAGQALEVFELQSKWGKIAGVALPAIALDLLYFRPLEYLLSNYALPHLQSASDAFTPVSLQLLEATGIAVVSPTKPWWLLSLGIPAIAQAFLANPHFSGPYNLNIVNRDLSAHDWKLLDRAWSNTGYLSVLENTADQYRVLRCDHSLLGGEWLLTEKRKGKQGWKVNEPIYSVFSMLEAIRLLEIEPPVSDSDAQALVVGLGIGTAPKALVGHGIDTTILEIDPVIYDFATRYFDLPTNMTNKNSHVLIQDAVPFAAAHAGSKTYDYILHDVFTGGAEPLSLFTHTFLADLRSLLSPNGVIAVNYAGDVTVALTTRILNTIDQVFDDQCKIFRDAPPPSNQTSSAKNAIEEEDGEGDFTNMVIFCRNSPGEIAFRTPKKGDFLGSRSREQYLVPRADLELKFPLRYLTTAERGQEVLHVGEEGEWTRQQDVSAIRHWHIMRRVMPAAVWELW